MLAVLAAWARGLAAARTMEADHAANWRRRGRSPGDVLLVALGDSLAQGMGSAHPERSWAGRLADAMEARTGRRVRVLCLGVVGAGAMLANVRRVLHFWREGNNRASRIDPRYSADAFRRCKIHYLCRSVLRGRDAVNVWGAGRVGKDFARALYEGGITVRAFFDIDPRKIGQRIHDAPVRDARDVGDHI